MICIPKLALEIRDISLPVTVLLPRLDDSIYWYWLVGILVGILSTKEFGGNSLRFGGKTFFPQNGGWAPQKRGYDPPIKEKRGSCQKNNTKMYRPSFPPVSW